jgi:hypothetical protein
MADELIGWQRDPFGAHEFRFFSDDGRPTLLVRDGEAHSHDPPPETGDLRFFAEKPENPVAPTRGAVHSPYSPEQMNGHTNRPDPSIRRFSHYQNHRVTQQPLSAERRPPPVLTRPVKIAYGVVLAAMAGSGVALAVIHLTHETHGPRALSATTTTLGATTSVPTTTTTVPVPSAPQPTAAQAAADLVSGWASGNQAEALAVATGPSVSTLFTAHYSGGLAIDRGCSVAFSPIVCTYGPPGGANPADPIYEIYVSQAAAGWYVSSVKVSH